MLVFGRKLKEREFIEKKYDYEVRWKVEKVHCGYLVKGVISGKPGRVEIFRTVAPKVVVGGGWNSWSDFKCYDVSQGERPTSSVWLFRENPTNEDGIFSYQVITQNSVYGFLSAKYAHPFFKVENGELVGYLEYFNSHLSDVEIEPFVILEGVPVNVSLNLYSYHLKKASNPYFQEEIPLGWCSWYQYYTDITWGDVEKNLKLAPKYGIKIFQIDDGYEADIGDWFDTKEGFPDLESVAEKIKENGLIPGIWIAPFLVSETSRIFHEHPDWVVGKNEKPTVLFRNWNKNIYALDYRKPEVKEHILGTLKKLKCLGFKYFKLDFLFAGFGIVFNSDGDSPVRIYREFMEKIRKTLNGCIVNGCGAPLLETAGYVDAMRVGGDTTHYWDCFEGEICAKNSLRNAITRYFYNKKLWINDPDVLMLRCKETKLSKVQREAISYLVNLLDGLIFLSDDLSLIESDGFSLFKEAQELKGGKVCVSEILVKNVYEIVVKGTMLGNVVFQVDLKNGEYKITVDRISKLKKKTVFREDGRIFNFYGGEF